MREWLAMLTALLLALASPVRADSPYIDPNEDWLPKNLDWEKASVIQIDMDDNTFAPDEIRLALNRPYRLIVRNVGKRPHDIFGLDFYHAVVLARVSAGGATIKTAHAHALYLQAASRVEIWFVPVQPGVFEFVCTLPGHREDGMEGRFRVE